MTRNTAFVSGMTIPAIVITGPRRSGSHLILHLLDGHPALFPSFGEVYLLEYAAGLSDEARRAFIDFYFSAPFAVLVDALDERMLLPTHRGAATPTLDIDALRAHLDEHRGQMPRTIAGVWHSWMAGLQSAVTPHSAPRPSFIKSPDYGTSALAAAAYLDDFKVIFTVRNPVLAINSLRKLHQNKPERWELTTTRVLAEVSRHRDLQRTIADFSRSHADRMMVVRLEDVVGNTGATMRAVCDFLDIDFTESVLKPTFDGAPWSGNSSFDEFEAPPGGRALLLSGDEVDMICSCLDDVLEAHGYTATVAP